MNRNVRDLDCQMSHRHLLFSHGNRSQICSSNILNSQHATEYNHWLSTMAYCRSEFYDPQCYDTWISRHCLNYNHTCPPRAFRQGVHARGCGQGCEQGVWQASFVTSSPGCRAALRHCNALPSDICSNLMTKIGDASHAHGMQEVCDHVYKESSASQSALNLYPTMMRGSSNAWTPKIRRLEFRNDILFDDDLEHDSIDVDELNPDYNITSTLCGLEEVLSRLI